MAGDARRLLRFGPSAEAQGAIWESWGPETGESRRVGAEFDAANASDIHGPASAAHVLQHHPARHPLPRIGQPFAVGLLHDHRERAILRNAEVKDRLGTEGTTQRFLKDAPIIVACVAEKRYRTDAIIAVDHLVLAARNEGVGTCWVGFFDGARMK